MRSDEVLLSMDWIGHVSVYGSSGWASTSAGFDTSGTAWHVTAQLRMDIGDSKTNPKEANTSSRDDFENRMMKNFGSKRNQNLNVFHILESSQE